MMATNFSRHETRLVAAIDRHGANLAGWRDGRLAQEVREAALADRRLRAYLDGAAALDDGLRAARDAIDAEIDSSGAVDRVSAAVLARLPRRRHRARWIAAAAAIILAAGLGSVVDLKLVGPNEQARVDVVVLDPLVFGPTEIEQQ